MKNLSILLPLLAISLLPACNNTAKNTAALPIKIQNNGVNIAYTDTGKSDTTLLFVHGWCINKSYFTDQSTYFGKRYRVVTIDLPGYGQSGKNRASWTVNDFGKDVAAVVTQLNLKNVILIGHSMAGAIIVQAKIDVPGKVIGLVGIDNFKDYNAAQDTAKPDPEFAKVITMLKKNFKTVATGFFNQYLFYKTTDTLVRKRILNDVTHADSAIAIASMEDNSFKTGPKLKAANMKLHLVNSDYFPNDTTGFIKAGIPYQLLVIHATGHFPMVEKPKEFNVLLQKAIDDIGKH
ncbi:alpha/beta fold hydrolase [Mucilaginibacter dorajii]|uniref:AB hydrolase-1 domain-containing protein n=1 Tax=Mucilaginibacter dorajii TaxID=692994 RepID=A0ABP7RBU6_9SPHI|nr:alpha/beta hydrolase [Mucilaginibacter dorajii]MCS3736772.1 pimeloyl-ACP methyl ester carboxylesterase [Mucilaginibacter dorajii]